MRSTETEIGIVILSWKVIYFKKLQCKVLVMVQMLGISGSWIMKTPQTMTSSISRS
jgi:hypothetical protein